MMKPEKKIRAFLERTDLVPDAALAELICWAEDGNLCYSDPCCCLLGVASGMRGTDFGCLRLRHTSISAAEAEEGFRRLGYEPAIGIRACLRIMWTSPLNEAFAWLTPKYLPGGSDELRNKRLVPLLHAERDRRDAQKGGQRAPGEERYRSQQAACAHAD